MRRPKPHRAGLVALALGLGAACGPAPAPLARGTYAAAPDWVAREARPVGVRRQALTHRVGEVLILAGDADTVSGREGQLGLRLDEDRNDVAAVTQRVAEAGADVEAILVLFTTFDDLGSGGPAYYVPFFADTAGLGLDPVDQRDIFGVDDLLGIANLKRLGSRAPEDRVPLLTHEIAHRHLAYLEAAPAGTATTAVPLLGRQQAHWHAALHTDGSVLGGHGFVERTPGRFVVSRREVGLSSLDLYGLGLLSAAEVEPTFWIEGARTEAGFAIPAEAELEIGAEVLGTRRPVAIEDVVAALGPRRPARDAPVTRLVFALLTAPDLSVTSSVAVAEAEAIDRLREALADAWPRYTRGRGALCTALDGCSGPATDAGVDAGAADAGSIAEPRGGCAATSSAESAWLIAAGLWWLRRRGCRHEKARARPRSNAGPP